MSDHFDNKLKRKLESGADETGRSVSNVRRIELITGTGRRRWSSDDKACIVEESLKPGATVSEVARRNGQAFRCVGIEGLAACRGGPAALG